MSYYKNFYWGKVMDKAEIKNLSTIVFASDVFSFPIVKILSELTNLKAIVTQPNRPHGRGKTLKTHPIKDLILGRSIPIYQPQSLKAEEFIENIRRLSPEVIIVVAYGPPFITETIMDIPKYGCLNIHPSLLPKYKGASPIQAAILNGDPKTGITIIKLSNKVDGGDLFSQEDLEIFPTDNSETLSHRLSILGAKLLVETLQKIKEEKVIPIEQTASQEVFTRKIEKDDAFLDFSKDVQELERAVRAYYPKPIAWTYWKLKNKKVIFQILAAKLCNNQAVKALLPGKTTISPEGYPIIYALSGGLIIEKLRIEGRNIINGKDFLNGYAKQFLESNFSC